MHTKSSYVNPSCNYMEFQTVFKLRIHDMCQDKTVTTMAEQLLHFL